jgi:hypothetical protein
MTWQVSGGPSLGELGISKDDLYLLGQERLAIKKPIRSLKELTQRDLQRLHHVMIYKSRSPGASHEIWWFGWH